MPVNPVFNFFNNQIEQKLYDNLAVESIRMYGFDCFYIPRNLTNYDKLYGTDEQSTYTTTYLVEMYLKNVMGFEGDRSFMSKLAGLEIRDQITLVVARTTFQNLVTPFTTKDRPQEGDLIFWPPNKKCFIIRFVNPFTTFYPFGALYLFEMTCELFEYSDETFSTGNPDIDILQTKFSTNVLDWAILDESGNQVADETLEILTDENFSLSIIDPQLDNDLLAQKGNILIDFSESDPYSEGSL